MKNFVEALDKEEETLDHLKEKFSKLSLAKIKEVFVRPQIRKVLNDSEFEAKLTRVELAAWDSFKAVVHGFLGNLFTFGMLKFHFIYKPFLNFLNPV